MTSCAPNYTPTQRLVVYLIIMSVVAGCTTMQPLSSTSPSTALNAVDVGDTVRISKNNGTEVTFEVTKISRRGIEGENVAVAYRDMRAIHVQRLNYEGAAIVGAALVGFVWLMTEIGKGLNSMSRL